MVTLDQSRAGICATLKASTKLPHCGSDGHSIPSGVESDGCERGGQQAEERQQRQCDQQQEQQPPGQDLAARDDHVSSPRASRWIGSTQTSTRMNRTTARADAKPTCLPAKASW